MRFFKVWVLKRARHHFCHGPLNKKFQSPNSRGRVINLTSRGRSGEERGGDVLRLAWLSSSCDVSGSRGLGGKCFTGQLTYKDSSQNKIFLTTSCWPELVGAKFHFALWAKCEAGPYPVYSLPPYGPAHHPGGAVDLEIQAVLPRLGLQCCLRTGETHK